MQLLRLGGDAVVFTADSANLSITDNLDLRMKLIMDDWQPTGGTVEQCFIAKRQGGDEWTFRTDLTTGRLQFVWWDTGGVATSETASADVPFTSGTHWIRARRSGTSVNFWTSNDTTNDHTAVSWTALGATQTTPAGSIRSTVATHVTIGAEGNGRNTPLYGYVYAAAVVDNVTTRADPVFASSTEWTVGEDAGDTASDGVNTWTLGGNAEIVGDNVEGAHVAVEVAFGANPWDASIVWSPITDDVQSISTSRGRNYELDRFDAGTATFQIDNTSGWYHSHNTASPYYPNVKPMVPIRVRAVLERDSSIRSGRGLWNGGRSPTRATSNPSPMSMRSTCSNRYHSPVLLSLTVLRWLLLWRRWPGGGSPTTPTRRWRALTTSPSPGLRPGIRAHWPNDFAGTFDGVDDFATVANEADVELLADMSIEMWFKPQLEMAQTVTTVQHSGSHFLGGTSQCDFGGSRMLGWWCWWLLGQRLQFGRWWWWWWLCQGHPHRGARG